MSGVPDNEVESSWGRIFPRIVRRKDSWEYMLEHTLYKPRDVLQFLKCCQDTYPEKEQLSYSEMTKALKIYSKDYFIEEMKNEITGFIDDKLINMLPSLFTKIGRDAFEYNKLMEIINQQSTDKKYEERDIKFLLKLLFEAGYVGQIVKNGCKKESVIFKYRNTTANIDFNEKFIIHQGLHKGLGIRL